MQGCLATRLIIRLGDSYFPEHFGDHHDARTQQRDAHGRDGSPTEQGMAANSRDAAADSVVKEYARGVGHQEARGKERSRWEVYELSVAGAGHWPSACQEGEKPSTRWFALS